MVSQRKLEANRRNAQKSTGPKTERGKRRVARNGLKHGLCSQAFPLLPFENESEYRALADAMERDLAPAGILQREIVTHITQICWRLRRIPAIEAALVDHDVTQLERAHEQQKDEGNIDPDTPMPSATAAIVLACHFARPDDRPYERLEMYRVRLERGLHAALRQLKELRSQTAGEEIDPMTGLANFMADQVRLKQKTAAIKAATDRAEKVLNEESTDPEPDNRAPDPPHPPREESIPTTRATDRHNPRPHNAVCAIAKATQATLRSAFHYEADESRPPTPSPAIVPVQLTSP